MKHLTTRVSLLIIAIVVALSGVVRAAAPRFETLYDFTRSSDGAYPEAPVVIGARGVLYGTTYLGGTSGNGTVYSLTPLSQGGSWTIAVASGVCRSMEQALPCNLLLHGRKWRESSCRWRRKLT